MKTAILMRHGEAVSQGPDGDRARPLTSAGREQARRVGQRLGERGVKLDCILCSSATRARQTAELVASEIGFSSSLAAQDALYGASDQGYLQALRALPDNVSSVLLVAHNPGIGTLAMKLCGAGPSFDPGAIAIGSFEVDAWAKVGF